MENTALKTIDNLGAADNLCGKKCYFHQKIPEAVGKA
jgi:hypothetical protein